MAPCQQESCCCNTSCYRGIKVAQEGHDQTFNIFLLVYLWSKFFSSKFSGEGVGAMPYLLTNCWSRDSMYDGFKNVKT